MDYRNSSQQTGEGHGHTLLNISGREAAAGDPAAAIYLRQSESGANWFFWIAGLSIVNTLISLANGQWSFLAGLGITQLIDGFAKALAQRGSGIAIVIGLLANAVAAGAFVIFGLMARKQQRWAFLVGMACYAVDGLIFLMVQQWLSMGFHVLALYFIFKGFNASNKLHSLMAEAGGQAKGQSA